MAKNLAVVILAAGKGTRMKSNRAKALHMLAGQPLINHVVKQSLALQPDYVGVVIGHQGQQVKEALRGFNVDFMMQEEQLGTGHALMQSRKALKEFRGDLVVLYTDIPLLRSDTIMAMLCEHRETGVTGTVLTAEIDNPKGYGRIVRHQGGNLIKGIVEEKDLPAELQKCREINTGAYVFAAPAIFTALAEIDNKNAQGEFYLTDVIKVWQQRGQKVGAFKTDDAKEALGINNKVELAEAERIIRERILRRHMLAGVTIEDPANTYIEEDVEIGSDTIIKPGCFLIGGTIIADECEVGPYTSLIDCRVESGSHIFYSYCQNANIGIQCRVGPFSHLRPGAVLAGNNRIGNFVEVKQSLVGPGSKAAHLSYVGDAQLAENCNIGAGTVVANYDGKKKNKTDIGAGVFIGSNTTLVAPVRIGTGARTGAGAVVTKDVSPGVTVVGIPAKPIVKHQEDKK